MNDIEFDAKLRMSAPPAPVPDGLDGHTSRILRAVRGPHTPGMRAGLGVGITAAILVGAGATAVASGVWGFTQTSTNSDGLSCTTNFRVTGMTRIGPNDYGVRAIGQQGDVSDEMWAAANAIMQGIDMSSLDPGAIEREAEWYRANQPPAGSPQWTESQIKAEAVIGVAGRALVDELLARGFAEDEIKLGLGGSEVGCT